jgi:hypothetical protein
MIADLKADSERWEAERRQTASRGQPANVGYRDSNTHQTRQYYGPTETGQPSGYPSSSAAGAPLGNTYDSGPQYQQQPSYAQPAGYPQTTYAGTENYYVAGGDLVADQSRSTRVPVSSVTVPRSGNNTYASTPTYQQPDPRAAYYSGQPPQPAQAQPVYASPQDPYYGRAVAVTGASYESQDAYDNRPYQDTGYSQPPSASSSNIPATSNTSSRREREREPDRDSRSHRHGGRR